MSFDLDKLNSLTKYPSIPTYHELGDRGRVRPDAGPQVSLEGETVLVTEKVDGTNGRIVFLAGGDWFIGGERRNAPSTELAGERTKARA